MLAITRPSLENSLSLKLIIPLAICGSVIILLLAIVIYFNSEFAREKHVRQQAIQFAESFLIATEVNHSRASITRTANSLGTYKGIKGLFIVDAESERIIASNMNAYVGAELGDLPAPHHFTGFKLDQLTGNNFFTKMKEDNYAFAYRAKIISEDSRDTNSIIILMSLTSAGIGEILTEFRNTVVLYLILTFFLMLAIFYMILRLTLLKRIETIVNVIEQSSKTTEPQLVPVTNNDELGVLILAYNNSLISDHEHKSELIKVNKALSDLSDMDFLTEVSNRRRFDRALDDEWKRGARQQFPLALLMIDIDNFKQLNDHHGHIVGDNCLKAVAAALKQQLKRPGELLSRYGGEEFSIILPNTGEGASVVAESCRRVIEELEIEVQAGNPHVSVTISIGVAYVVPQTSDSPSELLELADKAMYSSKRTGKNQVTVLEKSLPQKSA